MNEEDEWVIINDIYFKTFEKFMKILKEIKEN